MIIHDYSWLFMIIHDYSWLFVIIHDYSWLFMIIHDYPNDYPWLFMIIHDYSWLPVMNFWIADLSKKNHQTAAKGAALTFVMAIPTWVVIWDSWLGPICFRSQVVIWEMYL